jgi:hypothetical protein
VRPAPDDAARPIDEGGSRPTPDEAPRPVRVGGSGNRSRGARSLIAIAIAFLVLALVKPWGSPGPGDPGTEHRGTPVPTTAVAVATASPTSTWPWDPNATTCLGPDGLIVVTLVRWPGHEVRTWQPATAALSVEEAVVSSHPIIVRSSHIVGLGICRIATRSGAASTAAAEIVDVVQLGAGAPPGARRDLGTPSRITLDQPTPYLGILYGPPPLPAGVAGTGPSAAPSPLSPAASGNSIPSGTSAASSPGATGDVASWAPGSYAVGIQFQGRGPASILWVAVTIVAAPGEPT